MLVIKRNFSVQREQQLDRKKYQREMDRLYHELKVKQIEEKHELEMSEKSAKGKTSDVVVKPCLSKNSPFDESKHEIESNFRRFERYATVMSWEKTL